jgi:acyl-CoA thioester hydrolase
MLSTYIQPRFGDIDCFGHINNAVLANWFETARYPFLRFFVSNLNTKMESFPLIIAHTDFDFENELYMKYEVEIHSWVTHIGNNSFTVYHEAWQRDRLCVKGSAVLVYYDIKTKKSIPIPAKKRKLLEAYLIPEDSIKLAVPET